MYIGGLIPRKFAELAEAVLIGTLTRHNQKIMCAQSDCSCKLGHPPSLIRVFMGARCVSNDQKFLHSDNDDHDQTELMPMLI